MIDHKVMAYLIPFFLFVVTGSAAAKMDFLVGVVSGRWNESPQPLDWVAGMLTTTVAISASVGCYAFGFDYCGYVLLGCSE